MVAVAFYKYNKSIYDRLLSLITGKHTHVEISIDNVSYSASSRDGGVRKKLIYYKPYKWDIIYLPNPYILNKSSAKEYFNNVEGMPYDYMTAILSHLGIKNYQNKKKFYCVEIVAAMLNRLYGLKIPHNSTLKELYNSVINLYINEKGNYGRDNS